MHPEVKRLDEIVTGSDVTDAPEDQDQESWLSVYLGDGERIPRVYTTRRHVHDISWWHENNGLVTSETFGVTDRTFSGRYIEFREGAPNGIEIVSEYTVAYRNPRTGYRGAIMLETYDPDAFLGALGVAEAGAATSTSDRIAQFLGLAGDVGAPEVILPDNLLTAADFYASALNVITEVGDELLKHFAADPRKVHDLKPREFEKLVARLLRDMGYQIFVTPEQKDGGKDIIALQKRDIGNVVTIVECKKWSPDHPVSVEVVRGLYGVLTQQRATTALVATTSRYTAAAYEFRDAVRYQMELRDFSDIANWLAKYG
jgi:hypothetical protein